MEQLKFLSGFKVGFDSATGSERLHKFVKMLINADSSDRFDFFTTVKDSCFDIRHQADLTSQVFLRDNFK